MKQWIYAASGLAILCGAGQATAQELPTWKPSEICLEDSAVGHCVFLENQARRDLSAQWGFIPANVRKTCLTRTQESDETTWRLLGECLAAASRGEIEAGDAGGAVAAPAAASSSGDASAMLAAKDEEIAGLNAMLDTFRQNLAEKEAALSAAQADAVAAGGGDDRIAELEAELEKSQAAARSGDVRIKGLQDRLMAAMAAAPVAAAAGAVAADSSARVSELEAEVEQAQSALAGAKSRIMNLQDRMIADRKAASEAESSRIAELEAEVEKAQAAARSGDVRIKGLQDRLMAAMDAAPEAGADDASAARIAELEAAVEKAEAAARSGDVRIKGLQERLMAAMDAAPEAGADDASAAEIARLEGQLENQRNRSARVADTVSRQRDQIRELQAELSAASAALKAAEKQAMAAPDASTASAPAGVSSAAAACEGEIREVVADGGIQFQLSSAELSAAALPVMDSVVRIIRTCPEASIVVEGHTDSFGDPAFNQQLSERRAQSVVDFLTARGVRPAQVSAVGRGADDPVATNDTRAGRAQNRRIEFVLR